MDPMLLQYMKESEGKSDQKYLKSFIRVMQHMGPDQNQGVGIEALSTSAGAKVKQIQPSWNMELGIGILVFVRL